MTIENNRVNTLAKLISRVFHVLEEVEDLKNAVPTCLLWPTKDNIEINQRPANHTERDERLGLKESAAWRRRERETPKFGTKRIDEGEIIIIIIIITVSFERNCSVALMGKWNTKIWNQTSWWGSNFHSEEISWRFER